MECRIEENELISSKIEKMKVSGNSVEFSIPENIGDHIGDYEFFTKISTEIGKVTEIEKIDTGSCLVLPESFIRVKYIRVCKKGDKWEKEEIKKVKEIIENNFPTHYVKVKVKLS
jgi:hypothetical protein